MRTATLSRDTAETQIRVALEIDGTGTADVHTGIRFLDHMIIALVRHGRFDLRLIVEGDLDVDDHHTAEDSALVLGMAFDEALGERRGITRFGSALVPFDEAMARVAVDLSGRPWPCVSLGLTRERIGKLSTENITHWFNSFAMASRTTLHIDLLRGSNDHHRAEAAFKGLALSLRQAVALDGSGSVPSTKGVL